MVATQARASQPETTHKQDPAKKNRKMEFLIFFFRQLGRDSFLGFEMSEISDAHMSKNKSKPYKIRPVAPIVLRVLALKMTPFRN